MWSRNVEIYPVSISMSCSPKSIKIASPFPAGNNSMDILLDIKRVSEGKLLIIQLALLHRQNLSVCYSSSFFVHFQNDREANLTNNRVSEIDA